MKFQIRLAVLAAAVAATPAFSAERVWDGGGGGLNGITLWDSAGNWVNDIVAGPSDDALFATGFGSGTRINSAGSRTINKLVMYATQSFSIENFGGSGSGSGNSITLASGDINRSNSADGTQTISSNLSLASAGDWFIGGAGSLAVTGKIDSINGAGIYKTGRAPLTLSNDVTLFGALTAADGTTEISNNANVRTNGALAPVQTLAEAGGVLSVKGGAQLTTRGSTIVQSGGSVRLSDPNTRWTNAVASGRDELSVGDATSGSLVVENQASFISDKTDLFVLGKDGGSTMTVRTGGMVRSDESAVGAGADGQGSVTVTGAGSNWTATTIILGGYVGNLGRRADLTVSDGGSVVSLVDTQLTIDGASLTVSGGTFTTPSLNSLDTATARITLSDPAGGGAALTTSAGSYSGSVADAAGGAGSIAKTGTGTLTLRGPLTYTGITRVQGGTLNLISGIANRGGAINISTGATLAAKGFVNRPVAGLGTIRATDTLLIGDLARPDGFEYAGTLTVGAQAVTLLDADRATLTGPVTISGGGRLGSFAGIESFGALTANGPTTVLNNFTNQGVVHGPADDQTLTFAGPVSGAGSYTGNVTFAGGFSPGNSPALVSLGTTTFDAANVLTMELGGTTAGAGYDQLLAQSLALDGTLRVVLLNGFMPEAGDAFTLINGPMTGGFNATNLPALASGLSWQTVQTGDRYTLAVIPEPASLALGAVAAGLIGRRRRAF